MNEKNNFGEESMENDPAPASEMKDKHNNEQTTVNPSKDTERRQPIARSEWFQQQYLIIITAVFTTFLLIIMTFVSTCTTKKMDFDFKKSENHQEVFRDRLTSELNEMKKCLQSFNSLHLVTLEAFEQAKLITDGILADLVKEQAFTGMTYRTVQIDLQGKRSLHIAAIRSSMLAFPSESKFSDLFAEYLEESKKYLQQIDELVEMSICIHYDGNCRRLNNSYSSYGDDEAKKELINEIQILQRNIETPVSLTEAYNRLIQLITKSIRNKENMLFS